MVEGSGAKPAGQAGTNGSHAVVPQPKSVKETVVPRLKEQLGRAGETMSEGLQLVEERGDAGTKALGEKLEGDLRAIRVDASGAKTAAEGAKAAAEKAEKEAGDAKGEAAQARKELKDGLDAANKAAGDSAADAQKAASLLDGLIFSPDGKTILTGVDAFKAMTKFVIGLSERLGALARQEIEKVLGNVVTADVPTVKDDGTVGHDTKSGASLMQYLVSELHAVKDSAGEALGAVKAAQDAAQKAEGSASVAEQHLEDARGVVEGANEGHSNELERAQSEAAAAKQAAAAVETKLGETKDDIGVVGDRLVVLLDILQMKGVITSDVIDMILGKKNEGAEGVHNG